MSLVLWLVLAHWLVEMGPRVSGYRALRVLGLVKAHCCVGTGPGTSGAQDPVLGWWSAQGDLRQLTC